MKDPAWTEHEQYVADLFNGERTIGSGAIRERNDVETPKDGTTWRLSFECKTTGNKSKSIKLAEWIEARDRTYERSQEMRPAFPLRFVGKGAAFEKDPVLADLVLIDINDLAELRRELSDLRSALSRVDHNGNGLSGDDDGGSQDGAGFTPR